MKRLDELHEAVLADDQLDRAQLRELRVELHECVVDLEGTSAEERASLRTIRGRIDSVLRGEAMTLTMAEGNAVVREELRKRRQLRD